MTRYGRRFRKVSRTLSRVELMRSSMDETFALDEQDLLDKDAGRRFLDFYGDEGLRLALERYGFFDALEERGYGDITIETTAHDEQHTLLLDGRPKNGGEPMRLVELAVRRDRLHIDPPAPSRWWDVLTVDWLSLRNPLGTFTKERMRLPGQSVPGLGVGELVFELLNRVVERLDLDGLVTVAEYFHAAVLYARELPFADPYYKGQLDALCALLFDREKLSFAQAAWAVHWGHVLDVTDSVVRWKGEAMIKPSEEELANYLSSEDYRERAQRAAGGFRYRLARAPFEEKWAKNESALLEHIDDP